jgi:DNA polymerase III delta prime subunit
MSILNFSGFPGSEDVKARLSLAFDEGRFPHAIILEGTADSGKDILAGILAKAAICLSSLDGEGKPCGHCSGCVKAQAGSHPDIFTLDGDTDPRAFPIDAIRKIRSDAYIKPNEAPNKVYLLSGVQNMAEVSQNALLKVFEEPPENVLFILTAVSVTSLLPTVRSRAQIFSLEGTHAAGDVDLEYTAKLAKAITVVNEADLLFLTSGLIKDKVKLRAVLAQLVLIFRDAAVLRAGGTVCLSGQQEAAQALGAGLTRGKLLLLLDEARKAQRALDQNANSALLVTALCANFRTAAGR